MPTIVNICPPGSKKWYVLSMKRLMLKKKFIKFPKISVCAIVVYWNVYKITISQKPFENDTNKAFFKLLNFKIFYHWYNFFFYSLAVLFSNNMKGISMTFNKICLQACLRNLSASIMIIQGKINELLNIE